MNIISRCSWETLKISVLLTGSELVEGRLQDSNSHFIAQFLFEHGQKLHRVLLCDDSETEIVNSLNYLKEESDLIITSGGLGPTSGDKTREAIAQFLAVPLEQDSESMIRIRQFFARRNRAYDVNNDKQALVPRGARVLGNDFGTATCFAANFNRKDGSAGLLCALPGVPSELEKLIATELMPLIMENFAFQDFKAEKPVNICLGVFGPGEADIAAKVFSSCVPEEVTVSYRAVFPEVKVFFRANKINLAADIVDRAAKVAAETIGSDCVFSYTGQSLPETVHDILKKKNLKFACAESCSGGMLSALLTANPGSSDYFLGAVVAYDNLVKQKELLVKAETIAEHGAVSSEIALEMLLNCREKFGADISVSITGFAGPAGGSAEKPVGTVFIGFAWADRTEIFRVYYPASRERIREYSCYLALDQIRRKLLGLAGIERLAGIVAV